MGWVAGRAWVAGVGAGVGGGGRGGGVLATVTPCGPWAVGARGGDWGLRVIRKQEHVPDETNVSDLFAVRGATTLPPAVNHICVSHLQTRRG